MKVFSIDDPLYEADIAVLVGGTEFDVTEYLHKRYGAGVKIANKDDEEDEPWKEDLGNDGLEFHVKGEDECFFVWIARPCIRLLHHEVVHLTHDVLHTRGIAYADECEDAFTYWSARIFEQSAKKIFSIIPRPL